MDVERFKNFKRGNDLKQNIHLEVTEFFGKWNEPSFLIGLCPSKVTLSGMVCLKV